MNTLSYNKNNNFSKTNYNIFLYEYFVIIFITQIIRTDHFLIFSSTIPSMTYAFHRKRQAHPLLSLQLFVAMATATLSLHCSNP